MRPAYAFWAVLLAACSPNGPPTGSGEAISARPRVHKPITFQQFLDRADLVGLVRVVGVPGGLWAGTSSAPPVVTAVPVALFKGDGRAKALRIVWQTHPPPEEPTDVKEFPIVPPAVGETYMVYLVRGPGGVYERFDRDLSFHRAPPVPNVSVGSSHPSVPPAWQIVTEVSPWMTRPGERVQFRFYRTRLAEEPWEGEGYRIPASSLWVLDLTRGKVVPPKAVDKPVKKHRVVRRGETVADVIDLTRHFDLSRPGEYWLLWEGYPLRFEVADRLRVRTPPAE